MFRVQTETDSVHLMDGDEEIVMWDQREWEEDPSLVLNIITAVSLGYSEGADAVRRRLSQ